MAMTKKEKAEYQAALERCETLAALRWTDPVERDVPAPKIESPYGTYSEGWDYNAHSQRVWLGWSGTISHGEGTAPDSGIYKNGGRQNPTAMFSTKALALRAMRHEIEMMSAEKLLKIDRQIAEESHERL